MALEEPMKIGAACGNPALDVEALPLGKPVSVVLPNQAVAEAYRLNDTAALAQRRAALKEEHARLASENQIVHENAALAMENVRLAQENALLRMQSAGMPGAGLGLGGLGGYPCPATAFNPWFMGMAPGMWPQGIFEEPGVQKRGKRNSVWSTRSRKDSSGTVSVSTTTPTNEAEASIRSSICSDDTAHDADEAGGKPAPGTPMGGSGSEDRTTVMMRNLPNNYSRDMLTNLIHANGFKGCVDLIYLPVDFKTETGLGYAFVNLRTAQDASDFRQAFQGFAKWAINSEKVCDVSWSAVLQGVQDHIERYRNSPVMHETVPDMFKPALFEHGERVKFPEPTKKIRPPRTWSRRHGAS